jgi:hypothetical protein
MLRPLSSDINKQDSEIEAAQVLLTFKIAADVFLFFLAVRTPHLGLLVILLYMHFFPLELNYQVRFYEENI